jgi:hypothetical protein
VHAEQKLYLVFEFLDVDLKRYMENANLTGTPIAIGIVKVSSVAEKQCLYLSLAFIYAICDACVTRGGCVLRASTRRLIGKGVN